jgi:hypothetical protein
MAQINIPSIQETIIAVFVANVYPVKKLEANFNVLKRNKNTSKKPFFFTLISAEKHVE